MREKNNVYYGEEEHTNTFTIFGGIIMFCIWSVIIIAALVGYVVAMDRIGGSNEYYIDEETGEVYTRTELSDMYTKETWDDVVKFYNTHINTMEKS